MENVLIISSNHNSEEVLSEFISESFNCVPKTAESAFRARQILESSPETELVIINAPLSEGSALELAEYIVENTIANCIIIIKQEKAEKIIERAEKNGIIVLGRPFSRNVLYQLIRTVEIAVKRSWKLYQETVRLEEQISEIKTIDKAKFMLMEYREMTEEQAHSYLEQYAMNKRKKKNIAALEIIDKISEQYL